MPQAAEDRFHLSRRQFLGGAAASAVALSLYATEGERHWLSVERVTVRLKNLPAAFHGFTIAQLSDIHFHAFDEDSFVREAVDTVNKLKPDMVALTGDYITAIRRSADTLRQDADACAAILAGIQCPLRLCVLGNHDLYDRDMVIGRLRAHDLEVLNDAHRPIERGGHRIWISGLADAFYDQPNLARALPPARATDEPVVLLGHEPDFADTLQSQHGVDLMLAGHTHGGQVRLPFITQSFLPEMGRNYVEGLYRLGSGTQLYVNRGLGTIHLPIRFLCRPELTLLTLQPAETT